MNIKEIARHAGVSISTVSKIINNKDRNISPATRQKVIETVKKYNYTPYAKVKNNSLNNSKSFNIGILISGNNDSPLELKTLIRKIQDLGYTATLLDSKGDKKNQTGNLKLLCAKNIDGLIFEPVDEDFEEEISFLEKNNIKTEIIYKNNYDNKVNINYIYLDYISQAYTCTELLLKKHHEKILLLFDKNNISENRKNQLIQGIKKAYFINNSDFNAFEYHDINAENWKKDIRNKIYTAIILPDENYIHPLQQFMQTNGINSPEDVSIVCLNYRQDYSKYINNIAFLDINLDSYMELIANSFINKLESKNINMETVFNKYNFINAESIRNITKTISKNFLVIGSINIDLFLHTDKFPSKGSLTCAYKQCLYPGGKGANQAIGISRLEKNVSLIGKVGDDFEASIIYNCMNEHNIKTSTISKVKNTNTGKAYIFLTENGDSSITLLSGANENFKAADLLTYEKEFAKAHYCILTGELPYETIKTAAEMGKKHGCINVMKPASINQITPDLLSLINIFIPNLEEAKNLTPQYENIEAIAQYFRNCKVETVIITLEEKGCYVNSAEYTGFIAQNKFNVIDTTGGADAFISALCVYLSEGYSLKNALSIANYAAGFCVSRLGVIPALTDKKTLEAYILKESDIKLK